MAKIFVTGFSCFGEIKCNPTEEIIQELTEKCVENRKDTTAQAQVIGTKCLEVSAITVQEWIKHELYPTLDKLENPIVVVHLGVDEKSQNIKLESRACNEAKFRIPDQSGWQPDGVPINCEEECTYIRKTKLPIRKLAESLSDYSVQVSKDAGRYVCNYSYFISLEEAEKRNEMFSLFVHVPPFSKVPKETQLECLHALFEHLGRCLVEKCEGEDEEEEEEEETIKKDGNGEILESRSLNTANASLRKRCIIM